MKYAIGIDIGGTYIKSAVVDSNGNIIKRDKVPTNVDKGESAIVEAILSSVDILVDSGYSIAGIGIGCPGYVNMKEGVIVDGGGNMPLKDFPLGKILKDKYNLPVFIDNDATNAAKGEFLFGAGRGHNNMLCITLGTGIGGGLILGGKVYHGSSYYAGEVGHITLVKDGLLCSCGKRGCFEAYSSATAMINHAKAIIKRGVDSKLLDYKDKQSEIDARLICDIAREGDMWAMEIVENAAMYIGIALGSIVNVLNLELCLVGGGVSESWDLMENTVQKYFKLTAMPYAAKVCDIEVAKLKNNAGVLGSAAMVFMEG